MKQIELLDLTLKALYEKRDKVGEIVKMLAEKGVKVTLDDAIRLGRRLADAGFVKFVPTSDSAWVDMKSEGIEFVEGDSFTYKGQPVTNNNYTIYNSPNANLVNQSGQVTINQYNVNDAKQIIKQIKDVVQKDDTTDDNTRQEIIECVKEVEVGVEAGKTPKYALKSLIELASNVSSVGSLAVQLGQMLGFVAV